MSQPDALQLLARNLRGADRRSRWHDDPAAFATEAIAWPQGAAMAPYQAAALAELGRGARLAIRSPHGAGKSAVAALATLWFATTRDLAGTDWKVLTTAGSWGQLQKFLWPEVHLWAKRLRFDLLGIAPWRDGEQLVDLGIRLQHGSAFAASSSDPQLLEGAHAAELLVIADEAKAIPDPVFDSLEGALAGGSARALAISTPGAQSGRFYSIFARQPGLQEWKTLHFSLPAAIAAGRISREWADRRKAQWGEDSPIYKTRVEGEFAASEEDGLIPLQWVEEAIARWHVWDDAGRPPVTGPRILGVDLAATGRDQTVIATVAGSVVESVQRFRQADTMQTTGRIAAMLGTPGTRAVVDVGGLGVGVVDRLREQRLPVTPFNASEKAIGHDRTGTLEFVNRRAAAWWKLRELLDPARGSQVALPDDDQLIADLTTPKWVLTSGGKVQVESKDEIRRRLHRSTDVGDAVVMAFSGSHFSGEPREITVAQSSWRTDPAGISDAVPAPGGMMFPPDESWGPGPLFTPSDFGDF